MGLEDICECVHKFVPVFWLSRRRTTSTPSSSLSSSTSSDSVYGPWRLISQKKVLQAFWQSHIDRVSEVRARSSWNSTQSNTFDKDFFRRRYGFSTKKILPCYSKRRDGGMNKTKQIVEDGIVSWSESYRRGGPGDQIQTI
eukprot:scaffold875_cov185-Amphora_coffeaeformis.AAC.10